MKTLCRNLPASTNDVWATANASTRIQRLAARSLRKVAQSACVAVFLFSGLAAPTVKAETGTLNGLASDAEARSNGTVANAMGAIGTLGGISGVQTCIVNMFQIPSSILNDPTQQFSAATYSIQTAFMAPFAFNGDLYGIGYSTSSTVMASDYYEGPLDASNTLIKDNFVPSSTPSYTTLSASNAALVNYLNAQLNGARADGAGTAYVFLRINPDAYIYWNGYQIGMTEGGGGYIPKLSYTTVASAPLWQNVAIGGGGYVTGLVASPTGSGIYARTDVGGAYRWDTANTKWRAITDSLPNDSYNNGPSFGIGSVAVDPNNANRVFISAGKYNYSVPSGIYTCADTSVTNPVWTVIDSTIRLNGNSSSLKHTGERMIVDPYNSNVVYYGTDNVSVSGGRGLKKYYYDTAWHSSTLTTPVVGDANAGITFVAVDKNGGSVSDGTRTVAKYIYAGVYSATAGSGGVYASSNGGAAWTKVTNVSVDKPARGAVDSNGVLYVTYNGGVVKLARGATAFTSISPVASNNYAALAVDPSVAGTVMAGEFASPYRFWRSINSGTSWVLMNRTIHAHEPDGTPSVTTDGKFDHLASLMINPANLDEVWASEYGGVHRTPNIQDTTAASDWYELQKGMEEVVPLDLKSAPSGASLLSGLADANGFVHNDPSVRPLLADKFDNHPYLSTTSLDFCVATSGSNTVWARVGDILSPAVDGILNKPGSVSLDDGKNWAVFGMLTSKAVTNGPTPGWETFDVGTFLKKQKAAGATAVTLCVTASHWASNSYLKFSSKEGDNPPQLLVNGTATLIPTADAYVLQGGSNTNYGASTVLAASTYYDDVNHHYRSYLKFDLTSVGSISSCTLRLYRLIAPSGDTNTYPTCVIATPTTSWIESGITWNNMPANYFGPPTGATGGRVAMSATDPTNMVWVPENGSLCYSKDRGVSWTSGLYGVSPVLMNTCSEFDIGRSALTSDRVAANTFYCFGCSGTVYRSTDGGANWSAMTTCGAVSTSSSGFKLEAVPGMSGKIWVCTSDLNTPNYFKYWNGTSMVVVPGISSVVNFAFGKAKTGNTNPTVFARKANGTYWYSTDATAGSTFTWTQMNVPNLNDSPGVMEGDMQHYGRLYVGTDGRGIFYADAP